MGVCDVGVCDVGVFAAIMYSSNGSSQALDNKANSLATRTLSGQGELSDLYQPV